MNHLIFFIVILILVISVKSILTIVKAANRINSLYDYFIIQRNYSSKELISISNKVFDRPDPNDGGGCPKEEQLSGED